MAPEKPLCDSKARWSWEGSGLGWQINGEGVREASTNWDAVGTGREAAVTGVYGDRQSFRGADAGWVGMVQLWCPLPRGSGKKRSYMVPRLGISTNTALAAFSLRVILPEQACVSSVNTDFTYRQIGIYLHQRL